MLEYSPLCSRQPVNVDQSIYDRTPANYCLFIGIIFDIFLSANFDIRILRGNIQQQERNAKPFMCNQISIIQS